LRNYKILGQVSSLRTPFLRPTGKKPRLPKFTLKSKLMNSGFILLLYQKKKKIIKAKDLIQKLL